MTPGPRPPSRGTPPCWRPATPGRDPPLRRGQLRDRGPGRRDGYTRIIGHLTSQFGLPAGLDPGSAVDILLTLAGPATYRTLVADYGWPHDRFVDWLTTTPSQQLGLT